MHFKNILSSFYEKVQEVPNDLEAKTVLLRQTRKRKMKLQKNRRHAKVHFICKQN